MGRVVFVSAGPGAADLITLRGARALAVADVVLFDAGAHWTVERAALASQGKHTPFLGYNLAGQVRTTIVAGHVAYQR